MHCHTLWILGEYATTAAEIEGVVSSLKSTLGDFPMVEDELKRAAGETGEEDLHQEKSSHPSQQQQQQKVTADGTYATQSAFSTAV